MTSGALVPLPWALLLWVMLFISHTGANPWPVPPHFAVPETVRGNQKLLPNSLVWRAVWQHSNSAQQRCGPPNDPHLVDCDCLQDLKQILEAMLDLNATPAQLSMVITSGIYLGDLGDHKQCLRGSRGLGHYCLSMVELTNSTYEGLGVPTGLCLPFSCSGTDVDRLVAPLLADLDPNITTETKCGEDTATRGTGFKAMSAIALALLISTQLATLIDVCLIGQDLDGDEDRLNEVCQRHKAGDAVATVLRSPEAKSVLLSPTFSGTPMDFAPRDRPRRWDRAMKALGITNLSIQRMLILLISMYSLRANFRHLMRKSTHREPYSVFIRRLSSSSAGMTDTTNSSAAPQQSAQTFVGLDALRVCSMMWIIVGHVYVYAVFPGMDDFWNYLPPSGDMASWKGQFIPAAFFGVDTFLWLTGFLGAWMLLRKFGTKPAPSIELPVRNVTPLSPVWDKPWHSPLSLDGRLQRPLLAPVWSNPTAAAAPVVPPKAAAFNLLKRTPQIYVLRALRLQPVLIACLLTNWLLLPGLGYGPFWNRSLSSENAGCADTWWANVLFINNIWPKPTLGEKSCAQWTWYLGVDMQFFLLAPLIIAIYLYKPRLGVSCIAALLAASTAAIVGISWYHGVSASIFDPKLAHHIYFYPHTRFQPFAIGMLMGILVHRQFAHGSPSAWRWRISKSAAESIALYLALGCFALPMFITTSLYSSFPEPGWKAQWQNTLFLSCSKLCWSLGISLLCSVAVFRLGFQARVLKASDPPSSRWASIKATVKKFPRSIDTLRWLFSWPLWTIGARLTFAAYLFHPMMIRFVYLTRSRYVEYSMTNMALQSIFQVIASYMLAFVVWMVIESPFSRLPGLIRAVKA